MTPDGLRALLRSPAESTDLDFKESVDWNDRRAKLELARDIVCLANRNGGLLVVGVADRGSGRFELVGLPAGSSIPDVTAIARLVANHFDPPVILRASEMAVDGLRYGVIQVDEFARTPHICKTAGQDSSGREVFREGDLLRRSDLLDCRRIDTAAGLQALIDSATSKTGAIVRSMLGPQGGATPAEAPAATAQGELPGPSKACDLWPDPPHADVPVRDLPQLLAGATVRSRGGVLIPRSIDIQGMAPSEVIREPNRIIIETTRGLATEDGNPVSIVEMNGALTVRLRERLWEAAGKVDFTSLVAYAVGCLLFGHRLYSAAAVERFHVRLGLLAPTGLALTADERRYPFLRQTYVATTTVDMLVDREVETGADADTRAEIARNMVDELAWYFGFQVAPGVFEAHLANTREYVPDV